MEISQKQLRPVMANYIILVTDKVCENFRLMGCYIQPVEVQTMLLPRFLPTEAMMARNRIFGHAVLSYM